MRGQLFCALMLLVTAFAAVDARRFKVIIDTDMGQAFDDTFAISLALVSEDIFDVRYIMTSTDNTTGRALLLAKFLHTINRSHIDIGVGMETTIDKTLLNGVGAQSAWAEGFSFSQYGPGVVHKDGIGEAIQILTKEASPEHPFIIIGLAPAQNLAEIFTRVPQLKGSVYFAHMGGSFFQGYGFNNSPKGVEYNIGHNASASQVLYNQTASKFAAPICAAPCDTSEYFQIYGENYQRFFHHQRENTLVATILENFKAWIDNGGGYGSYRPFFYANTSSPLYDMQTVYQATVAARRPGFDCSTMPFMIMSNASKYQEGARVSVESRGYTNFTSDPSWALAYESLFWYGGEFDGYYGLGTLLVDALLTFKL